MTDAATEPAPPADRERGWWRVALATLLFLFAPSVPLLHIVLPVDQELVLIAPALAACTVAGWWSGGRLPLALAWVAIAAWVLVIYTSSAGAFGYLVCGWSVLLSAAFAGLVIFARGEESSPFSGRAFAAIGLTLALATGATVATNQGVVTVRQMVSVEASKRSEQSIADWRQATSSKEWKEFFAGIG